MQRRPEERPGAYTACTTVMAVLIAACGAQAHPFHEYSFKEAGPADEAIIFTSPGFDTIGVPKIADGAATGQIEITVRDQRTAKPTFCRINVVGPDGHYYEPAAGPLKKYSLTGQWPKWPNAWGNRQGKAPVRYFGRFFYSDGTATVNVPAGKVRVEVWKGFEYRPEQLTVDVAAGETRRVEATLHRTVPMARHQYYSGDMHIHIDRTGDEDDQAILDLMQSEDIRFGSILAYNEPAGPYAGFMNKMAAPQLLGLGPRSLRSRGDYHIMSGQEYRSSSYGHINFYMLENLVLVGQSVNADHWPLYGHVARQVRNIGGLSFYAHGGYAKEIYADVIHGDVDGVELLQFGVYRGIGLSDWYRILNCGFRFPAMGASDYPACRKLGDCRTYVSCDTSPDFPCWLDGAAQGRSFFTTGPLLMLEVDGKRPGAVTRRQGPGPHTVSAKIRVRSEVAPVTHVQLIVNGRVVKQLQVPAAQRQGEWVELEHCLSLSHSSWIAARAHSHSRQGTPDAEAHTNPVYVTIGDKAPFDRPSLDQLIERIDGQIAAHKARDFSEKAQVLAYFEQARDILLKIREAKGAPANGHPSDLLRGTASLQDPGARSHTEEQLKEYLRPVPRKSIDAALEAFETVDGFRMEPVAREPMVVDPISAAFDENGNLYVGEMRDYPYLPRSGAKPLGTVRYLEDTDGDGRFDKSHDFARHLLWAGGIVPWKQGVFVTAPPDIWYLKDTDGDHKADVRQKVFTGFGTQNQQAMLNNLQFGLDHRIYGSTAGNGGSVRPGNDPAATPIEVGGNDFRFDPVSRRFEAITGTRQFGNTFDDWGNRFLCSESQPLQHAVIDRHYLDRNPYLPGSRTIQNVAPGPVPIYRISPIERWRAIRSGRRIAHAKRDANSAGASHHVVDAAAGVTVYRGAAYPASYRGNVFIGGGQNNIIHRRLLFPDGVTFQSQRADKNTEFVRSSDNWFRPVNFVNAPDGTLYVLDMSREVLEAIHIPLDVVKHLDLTSGRDSGRIYRIAPRGFKYPGPPRLGEATTQELVAALESPHGWWRDTAHRLIYERQDPAAVHGLRRLLKQSPLPQARLHALWSLAGLASKTSPPFPPLGKGGKGGVLPTSNRLVQSRLATVAQPARAALTTMDIVHALADPAPAVRRHAVRLAESHLDTSPQILEKVLALAGDPDAPVRLQVAFSLGEANNSRAVAALADMALRSADDRWFHAAILSSVGDRAGQLLSGLVAEPAFPASPSGPELLDDLVHVAGARNHKTDVAQVLALVATHPNLSAHSAIQHDLLLSLGRGLKRAGADLISVRSTSSTVADALEEFIARALAAAANTQAAPPERLRAIELLSCIPLDRSRETLVGLVHFQHPESIQIAAVRALSAAADPQVSTILLQPWREYTPAVRSEAIKALLSHEQRTVALLQAAAGQQVDLAQVEPSQRALLVDHRNATIRDLAEKLFGKEAAAPRDQVIDAYKPSLDLVGDAGRGRTVFERECIGCHRIGESGHEIGPSLASAQNKDAESLLVHILDPNRYVQPTFMQYVVQDHNGRSWTGMLAAQSAGSITLKREKNETDTILKRDIDQLVNTGRSIMPEGFEKKVTLQEMADLITHLQSYVTGQLARDQRLDIGTLPGLVEPEH